MNETRIQIIQRRLQAAFSPQHLEVIDDSELHKGHEGGRFGAGHYTIIIASESLKGLTRVESHRKIYAIFDDLIPNEIHALKIKILNL